MTTNRISVTVNGTDHSVDVEPRLLLIHLLRDVLDLTGTHLGCDTSSCGACTVMLNGKSLKACTMFAVQADGGEITTVEGLATDGVAIYPSDDPHGERLARHAKRSCAAFMIDFGTSADAAVRIEGFETGQDGSRGVGQALHLRQRHPERGHRVLLRRILRVSVPHEENVVSVFPRDSLPPS